MPISFVSAHTVVLMLYVQVTVVPTNNLYNEAGWMYESARTLKKIIFESGGTSFGRLFVLTLSG